MTRLRSLTQLCSLQSSTWQLPQFLLIFFATYAVVFGGTVLAFFRRYERSYCSFCRSFTVLPGYRDVRFAPRAQRCKFLARRASPPAQSDRQVAERSGELTTEECSSEMMLAEGMTRRRGLPVPAAPARNLRRRRSPTREIIGDQHQHVAASERSA
jgi:hypothetical protein